MKYNRNKINNGWLTYNNKNDDSCLSKHKKWELPNLVLLRLASKTFYVNALTQKHTSNLSVKAKQSEATHSTKFNVNQSYSYPDSHFDSYPLRKCYDTHILYVLSVCVCIFADYGIVLRQIVSWKRLTPWADALCTLLSFFLFVSFPTFKMLDIN